MFRNKSVDTHDFSMVPRAEVPRSAFRIQKTLKTCFDAGYLVPIYVNEILPGDQFNCRMSVLARLATPIFPFMDNVHLETFFFFVPCRLVWEHWVNFMGERRPNPDSSTSYVIPKLQYPAAHTGVGVGSLWDYMGLPTTGQVTSVDLYVNALPFRAYNLIYDEWFRDENLQDSLTVDTDDGPDTIGNYVLRRRGKRPDYFTTCLPWTQKGDPVTLPLGTVAPIDGLGVISTAVKSGTDIDIYETGGGRQYLDWFGASDVRVEAEDTGGGLWMPKVYADLSSATAATINSIRLAFQYQKLLERDARGGTRYTELVRSHFGVSSPDARLQRPEYIGGGSTVVQLNQVAQTSETADTPLGGLGAYAHAVANHGFSGSFTEHGYIVGLANVRAELTYQQGVPRMWSRNTREDFYFPAFASLGEQSVLMKEIYCTGIPANDDSVFGYRPRWDEYRFDPSQITSLMRSTAASTIDAWHLAQRFTSAPTLNSTFISDTPPLERVLAVGAEAAGQQIIFDAFFDVRAARPLPMHSVPGLVDHF